MGGWPARTTNAGAFWLATRRLSTCRRARPTRHTGEALYERGPRVALATENSRFDHGLRTASMNVAAPDRSRTALASCTATGESSRGVALALASATYTPTMCAPSLLARQYASTYRVAPSAIGAGTRLSDGEQRGARGGRLQERVRGGGPSRPSPSPALRMRKGGRRARGGRVRPGVKAEGERGRTCRRGGGGGDEEAVHSSVRVLRRVRHHLGVRHSTDLKRRRHRDVDRLRCEVKWPWRGTRPS